MQMSGDISYIERSGPGQVILFLHGIGSNAVSFAPIFELFPKSFRLIAWNAPGYLASKPLGNDWPMPEDYADALTRFLDTQNIEHANVVGHSLGTLMAGAFARSNPERVQSLVLAASANGYKIPVHGQMPTGVAARIEDLNADGPEAFAQARAARLVHEPEKNPGVVETVRQAMAQISPKGYTQAVRMLASGDLPAILAETESEPGFIIGDHDVVTPPAQTHAASAAWQKSHNKAPRIKHIDGAGHAVYQQKPNGFVTAILELTDGERCRSVEPVGIQAAGEAYEH